jgi:tripartite-type tricarboxylate transporter receptor subunit TctC
MMQNTVLTSGPFGPVLAKAVIAAAVGAVTMTSPAPVRAADYPSKNIEFVIPFSAGGGFDRTVRLWSPALERALPHKVQVLPTNVPGAGGRKALAMIMRAKPDGTKIAIANMPGAALPEMTGEKVEYDLDKMTWIARLGAEPYMVAVPAKSSIKSVADLKKLNRTIKIPSTDYGSTAFAAGVVFGETMGLKLNQLTGYKGTNDYIVATIRGDADACIAPVSTLAKFIKSGDMRGLVTFEDKSTFEGVPTIASLGHPELTGLAVERYVLAPPKTPANIVKVLSAAFAKASTDPQLIEATEKAKEEIAYLDADAAKAQAEKSIKIYEKHKKLMGRPNG